ncbi:MAG: hypothetical protein K2W91_09275 [Novosphingobium sp.]|nr:hypothetical protein [Novosphingobium sp.]
MAAAFGGLAGANQLVAIVPPNGCSRLSGTINAIPFITCKDIVLDCQPL